MMFPNNIVPFNFSNLRAFGLGPICDDDDRPNVKRTSENIWGKDVIVLVRDDNGDCERYESKKASLGTFKVEYRIKKGDNFTSIVNALHRQIVGFEKKKIKEACEKYKVKGKELVCYQLADWNFLPTPDGKDVWESDGKVYVTMVKYAVYLPVDPLKWECAENISELE